MADVVDSKQAKPRGRRSDSGKTALVLTGGGVTGGVYQIGALRALDLLGKSTGVNDFDMYVGTSCGAFVSALIANGAKPHDLMMLLDGKDIDGYDPLDMKRLLRPNVRGIIGGGTKLPGRALRIGRDIAGNLSRMSVMDLLAKVADLAPGGFYSLDGLTEMLQSQLQRDGFTDDFRELPKPLYIVSTDLDTCEPVVFGEEGWDDIPISKAVAASAALPVIYKGVEIRGREFVDGGLRAFANIDTVIEKGAKLVVIVNSIVPFDNERLQPFDGGRPHKISETGIANVGSQMLRCLVWSAFHERLMTWERDNPDVDFILIEPQRDDALMFGTQIMNVSQRVQIAKHGFESVTVKLASDFENYRDICARHGLEISRRRVIEALSSTKIPESNTTRWRRILERGSAIAR